MRVYKNVQVDNRVCSEIRCDLCGRKGVGAKWESGIYETNETELRVTIHQKEGKDYPDGGWGTEHVIDMCPQCFKEALIPWIRSQGGRVEEQEWDW